MNKQYPKKAKDIKGQVAIAELERAHWIIALLSVAFAGMIGLVSAFEIQFVPGLGILASILLLVVAGVSVATIVAMRNRS